MARYTKAQLEEFFYRQYEYIEALTEQLKLIKEQNELIKKENSNLTDRLGSVCKPTKKKLQKL